MTTPRVIELPRRMERSGADTFLGAEPERATAVVLPFRPRSGRRRPRTSRAVPAPPFVPFGDDVA